jgi:GAF domain-containing protein
MQREQQLVRAFVELADTLVDHFDVVEMMQRLVEHCLSLLNASAAGLLLVDASGRLQLVASSSDEVRVLELLQVEGDRGPCTECLHGGAVVRAADLGQEAERWPQWAQSAVSAGFRAVTVVPLRVRDQVIGSMSLMHTEPGHLPAEDVRVAQALAAVATTGVLQARAIEQREVLGAQLQAALTSRVVIEQAKGMLAERGGLSVGEAFERLRHCARRRGVLLSDLAGDVTAGRTDPSTVLAEQVPRRRPGHVPGA